MKTYVQDGDVIDVPAAPRVLTSGEGGLAGQLFFVAMEAAANGAAVRGRTRGVVTLPKATGAGWTFGQKLYWDNTAFNVTGTLTSNTFIGHAMEVRASGDTTGKVRLTGCPTNATF